MFYLFCAHLTMDTFSLKWRENGLKHLPAPYFTEAFGKNAERT